MKRSVGLFMFASPDAKRRPRAARPGRLGTYGQAFPLLAVMATTLFAFAGLGIDTSQNEANQMQSQGASDAAGVSAARIWSSDITTFGYTGAPPFSSTCTTNTSSCQGVQTVGSMVEPAILEAAEVAQRDNINSLILDKMCVFSNGTGAAGGSLHVAFYGTAMTSGNCPNVPSSSTFQRLDIYIPPQNPPAVCSPTWRCIQVGLQTYPGQNFGGVLGNPTVAVQAQASVYQPPTSPPGLPCSICALGGSGTTINLQGNPSLSVAGAILTNSTGTPAISVAGSSSLSASAIDTAGGTLSCSATCSPSSATTISPIPDPYAGIPYPVQSSTGSITCGGHNDCTATPGVFSSNVSVGSQEVLTMTPGVYVFEGGLSLGAGGDIEEAPDASGTGVVMYFTCAGYVAVASPGVPQNLSPCSSVTTTSGCTNNHGLNEGGHAVISINPPTSGQYQGLSVFYDRSLNVSLCLDGSGSATGSLGTIYAKSAWVDLTGNSSTASAIVSYGLSMHGNSGTQALTITGSNVTPVNDGTVSTSSYAQIAG